METTLQILLILFFHWIGDFIIQTEWQARNKSKRNDALMLHVLTYSLTICFGFLFILPIVKIPMVFIATYIMHYATDYITSRINSKLAIEAREKDNYHLFFISIGCDQFIHFVQLLLTYQLLK